MNLARLPLLEPHRETLEKCVYCPKLSRAACPVSNAEASETVTPWGKMSLAYFAARGDVPHDAAHASTAWACSACYACRERCDHKNEVATVLVDARAEHLAAGVAPEAARSLVERFPTLEREAVERIDEVLGAGESDGTPFVGGCGYARRAPDALRDGARAAAALLGASLAPVKGCCGLPLLYAGDRDGFVRHASRFVDRLAAHRAGTAVLLDPGCMRALIVELPRTSGRALPSTLVMDLFVVLAHRNLGKLKRNAVPGPVRYHDPCQLGRGLGRYDEPRAVLTHITGAEPLEFLRARTHGECSGAGGLLPAARPETSRAIADARIAEHRTRQGATLVTACASSLHRFRSRGEAAQDLASFVARALDV